MTGEIGVSNLALAEMVTESSEDLCMGHDEEAGSIFEALPDVVDAREGSSSEGRPSFGLRDFSSLPISPQLVLLLEMRLDLTSVESRPRTDVSLSKRSRGANDRYLEEVGENCSGLDRTGKVGCHHAHESEWGKGRCDTMDLVPSFIGKGNVGVTGPGTRHIHHRNAMPDE
jgi:hypothetical protein